jgi:hypothetical protein
MIDGTLAGLLQAARHSVQNPRAGARALLAMALPMTARWLAFGFVIAGSSVLTVLAVRLSPAGNDPLVQDVLARPIGIAMMQGVVMLAFAGLMHRVGRLAGGKGSFPDALLLLTWVQVILMLVQVVQIVLELVLPPAAEFLGLLGLGLMLWLVTHFVAELHGFTSLGMVFAGIVGTVLATGFAVSLLLVLIAGV